MMAGDKKRRGRRAYLDDFVRDLNGRYSYQGAHYRYTGSLPRGRALAWLGGLAAGALALLLAAGMLDGPGLGRCFYVLIPYAAAFVLAVWVAYTVGRLAKGGDPLREYVLEQTARRLPGRSLAAAVLAAAAAAGGALYLALNGPGWHRAAFILLNAGAFAAQLAMRRVMSRMDWEKAE